MQRDIQISQQIGSGAIFRYSQSSASSPFTDRTLEFRYLSPCSRLVSGRVPVREGQRSETVPQRAIHDEMHDQSRL
jgi:hypothetical protein